MNREVYFIADDFGLDPETNRAIVCAHRDGALHGASLMMGQPGTDDAVALAREHPTLAIGWHLHLCHSQPLTCAAWPWGDSPARAGWTIGTSPSAQVLMRREVAEQWKQYRATNLPCAFVNSHHHLHAHPMVFATMMKALRHTFHGWIRLGAPRYFDRHALLQAALNVVSAWQRRKCPFPASDTLWGIDRTYRMRPEEVQAAIATLPATGRHEFMFHPRKLVDDHDLNTLKELKAC